MRIKITRHFSGLRGDAVDENINAFSIVVASVFNESVNVESIGVDAVRCSFEYGDFRTDLKSAIAISKKMSDFGIMAFRHDGVLSTIESLRKFMDEM